MVCNANHTKSTTEYMPVIEEAQNYAVCKNYLDNLQEAAQDLDLKHIFAQADKVFIQSLHALFGNMVIPTKKVVIIIGGFHPPRVRQHLI